MELETTRAAPKLSVLYYVESDLSVGTPAWDFSEQLANWGPDSGFEQRKVTLASAQAYTRLVALTHYENFHVASLLIPTSLKQDFFNVYAYCRWSDDLADEVSSTAQALSLLDWWQSEFAECVQAKSLHPVMIALSETIRNYSLPTSPFTDLLSAFRQDQAIRRYDSHSQVLDYCCRSANPVGRIVLGLARSADQPRNLPLSDSICSGLQIANFCQDMARDAKMDRIYAPRELWMKHDVNESMILAARPTPQLRAMLEEWTTVAEELLRSGAPLENSVPAWLRGDLWLFRNGGLAILNAIRRAGFDVWTSRPVVSKSQKVRLLARALLRRWGLA